MNKRLLFAEKAFTIISLINYSGGPLVVILSGGASEGDEGAGTTDFALIQLLCLVIYLITFCLLILRWKKVIRVINKTRFIWLLLLLAFLSIFWSDNPDITRSRSIALFGTLLFSLYLASRYTLKEQLQLLGWTFGLIILMSLLFIVGLPKYGRMGGVHFGALRGIYNHKNVLGKIMSPSAIVFLLLAQSSKTKQWGCWLGFSLSILLIIGSGSSSSLINVFILITALFLLRILRWQYDLLIPTLFGITIIMIIGYLVVNYNAAAIAALFGKDLTLTGRTTFWPFMLDQIWKHPWLGYGFGAFWLGFDGPSAYVWYAAGWKAPNGHNGYFDLCLELGLVGLSIYLSQYVIAFQKALAYIRLVKTSDALWPSIYLIYIVMANLTESTLIIQNSIFLIIQIALFLSLNIVHKLEKQCL